MSIRQFRPTGDRRTGISNRAFSILFAFLFLTILLQMAYPLVHGNTLRIITLFSVYAGATAMSLHAWFSYGSRYVLLYIFLTFTFAFLVEEVGSRTGWPFGHYVYDSSLGIKIYGLPLIVPIAWLMLAHPVLVASRRSTKNWVFIYGGAGLMAWDLFLDPQMVAAHRWTWKISGPHIPFQPNIPLSNAAGWLLAGMGLIALLNFALPKDHRKRGTGSLAIDIFLYWTLFSGVVGNLFFFHRPGVAFFSGVTFAIVFTPYFFQTRFGRPDDI
jgi:uncharacterized membrane protein